MNEEVVNEVTKGGILKEAGKYGIGAVIGVGTFVLVRKAAGKISDIRKAKKFEPVDIDTDNYDVEEAEN